MDIQVLNEIANQARQTSLSQVKASIAANAQLKALKGNAVPASGDPSLSPFEDSPDQIQDPVAPDISSVARAASTYSSAVGSELNSDELKAIQDLAGRVRTAVSDFLSQPDLEQAENAATVVASNPEAVQELTSGVEQAVVATFNLSTIEGEAIVNEVSSTTTTDLPAKVPALEDPISIERITNGAESNSPVQVFAVSPAVADSRASENTVENPVTVEEAPESSRGDFRVTSASPALQNAQVGESVQVETPESQPEAVVLAQQEPVGPPEAVTTNPQEVPVVAPSPVLQNAQDSEAVVVPQQEPASHLETVATNQQVAPVTASSPALQNTQASVNTQVETPVSRPEAVAANAQEAPEVVARPESQNTSVQNAEVGNPVSVPIPPVDQGQGLEKAPVETVNPEGVTAPPVGESSQDVSSPSNPQPASTSPQPGPIPSNDLFAQERATVNPENIRDVNELVGSVLNNEFLSEAKKIFSEPKVIRTVADLADFILERLQEIIAIKQQQSQSSGETGIS